jgi:hypothetical protein
MVKMQLILIYIQKNLTKLIMPKPKIYGEETVNISTKVPKSKVKEFNEKKHLLILNNWKLKNKKL